MRWKIGFVPLIETKIVLVNKSTTETPDVRELRQLFSLMRVGWWVPCWGESIIIIMPELLCQNTDTRYTVFVISTFSTKRTWCDAYTSARCEINYSYLNPTLYLFTIIYQSFFLKQHTKPSWLLSFRTPWYALIAEASLTTFKKLLKSELFNRNKPTLINTSNRHTVVCTGTVDF